MRALGLRVPVVLSVLTLSCSRPSPVAVGHWLGDARRHEGVERLELIIDSSGESAQITMAAWQLDSVRFDRAPSVDDSVRFTAVVEGETVSLAGAVDAGRWTGALTRGNETTPFVVHAGSGTTVREEGVLYLQNELRAAGLPEASVAVGERYQRLDDRVTASDVGWEELQRFYEKHSRGEPWLWPPRPADDWFRAYYRMLMDFDPSPYWSRVTCPVLLFFGELDANVPPAQSWPPIEQALHAGGNPRVTQVVLPRANHVFLESRTGGRDEYPGLSHFVPGYFDRMAAWLATWAK